MGSAKQFILSAVLVQYLSSGLLVNASILDSLKFVFALYVPLLCTQSPHPLILSSHAAVVLAIVSLVYYLRYQLSDSSTTATNGWNGVGDPTAAHAQSCTTAGPNWVQQIVGLQPSDQTELIDVSSFCKKVNPGLCLLPACR